MARTTSSTAAWPTRSRRAPRTPPEGRTDAGRHRSLRRARLDRARDRGSAQEELQRSDGLYAHAAPRARGRAAGAQEPRAPLYPHRWVARRDVRLLGRDLDLGLLAARG